MYTTVLSILTQLAEEPSRNEKIKIIESYKEHKDFVDTIKAALDPMQVYGIKKIPDYRIGRGEIRIDRAINRLSRFVDKTYTGNLAVRQLVSMLETLDESDALVLERIIEKDLKCGAGISTFNKGLGYTLVREYPVELCHKLDDKKKDKINFPAYVQRKEDGVRCNAVIKNGVVTWFTRNGKPIEMLGNMNAELMQVFGSDEMVDGELLVSDGNGGILSRKKGNGIINKAIKGTISSEEASLIEFKVWGVVAGTAFAKGASKTPYSDIMNYLNSVKWLNSGKVSLVDTIIASNMEDVEDYYDLQLQQGYEGAILKDANHMWADKRHSTLLKLKAELTMDLRIKRIVEGTGKRLGKLGNFLLGSDDGNLECFCGSGLSQKQTEDYFTEDMVGKIVEVKYNEIISSESKTTLSLFLPIFVGVREDKDTTDEIN